jgi:uncharacterized protein
VKLARIAAAVFGLALTLAFARADVTVPPRPTQWVTDNAGALSQSVAASVNAELQAYQNATKHRVIVWIGSTTGGDQLEDWTSTVAQAWGIGRKQQSDGAVLFLFMQDHRVRIEVGYGLEPTLTDAKSSEIINQIILPKMRAGDVDGAVQGGVDGMLTAITPSYAAQIGHAVVPERQRDSGGYNVDGIVIAFLIFLLFGVAWIVIAALINGIRYVWTLLTKGPEAAAKVWHNAWITSKGSANGGALWPLLLLGSMGGGGGGGGFGGGGGGFSGGGFGGGFGGGGASGGW